MSLIMMQQRIERKEGRKKDFDFSNVGNGNVTLQGEDQRVFGVVHFYRILDKPMTI